MRVRILSGATVLVAIVSLAGWAGSTAQQTDRRLPAAGPGAQSVTARRLALVIGNDAYLEMRLANAVNDAKALGAALRDVGFDVQVETNVRLRDMGRAIGAFVGRLAAGDVALFYYSGHGIQVVGENYLLPVDFEARTPDEAPDQAYPMSRVQTRIGDKGAGLSILILDACRNNPFLRERGVGTRGWAAMQGGGRTFIAFATAPGETASDNPGGGNGLFTSHFLEVLRRPGLSLDQVFAEVGGRVRAASNQRQDPWVSASAGVGAQFVFRPAAAIAPPVAASPDLARSEELTFWQSIQGSRDPRVFEDYLARYPAGQFRVIAQSRLDELRAATKSTPPAPSPPSAPPGGTTAGRVASGETPPSARAAGDRWTSPVDGRVMVWIPPGEFPMGSPNWEKERVADEALHTVRVEAGFWLDATEVTNAAYQQFVEATPAWQKGRIDPRLHGGNYLQDWNGISPPAGKADHPVVLVTWYAARAYCGWAGKRLPTEAEWEYAARAGTTTAYWWGDAFDGSRANDAQTGTVAVGDARRTNPWGLSDMSGNVFEWTSTLYRPHPYRATDGREDPNNAESRVVRGGSWLNLPRPLRSADRLGLTPRNSNSNLGFRCAQ